MSDLNSDRQVRLAAFAWLSDQVKIYGDVLPRELLRQGFEFSGIRIPLVAPQGIFKPQVLDYPLTITTAPSGPYEDRITDTNFILYKYRGEDPLHRDNVGLREVMKLRLPLAYFHGVVAGKYVATWPVYVISDNPEALTFTVAVDEVGTVEDENYARKAAEDDTVRKEYITKETLVRLHQRGFREKVLKAYREQCALCKLRHKELLDAAHIIPDSDERGTATVDNGISLCKIHHAAFDRFIIGITPDFKVKVREDVLEEEDGPMLQHGLQELHDSSIILPRNKAAWPNRDSLDRRYREFIGAV